MTYEEFLAHCGKMQREYVREERERIEKAKAAFYRYKTEMSGLGLHPLTLTEIDDRAFELRGMGEEAETDPTDNPTMRLCYDMHLERSA